MKFSVKSVSLNTLALMRSLGYTPERNGSFARRVGREKFPRFHVYLEEDGEKLQMDLHLDQKAPSYQGSRAHSGEYDGELVVKEQQRILQTLK